MKKKQLLLALCVCTMVSLGTQALARDKDIPEIVNKTYENCSYNGNGGALFNTIDSVVKNSNFINNEVGKGYFGGAIYNSKGTLTVANTVFEGITPQLKMEVPFITTLEQQILQIQIL